VRGRAGFGGREGPMYAYVSINLPFEIPRRGGEGEMGALGEKRRSQIPPIPRKAKKERKRKASLSLLHTQKKKEQEEGREKGNGCNLNQPPLRRESKS